MTDERMFRVVKRYYLLKENQDTIARAEKISKSTISRLLKKAEQMGYVRHVIDVPLSYCDELEIELSKCFDLTLARVLPAESENEQIALFDVVLAAGQYLNQMIQSGDVVGVTWGNTMRAFAESLPECTRKLRNVKVVQLNGSVSRRVTPTYGDRVVRRIADSYDGEGYVIPAPSFADTPEMRDLLMQDSTIRSYFNLIDQCRIALFGIGALSRNSVLIQAGYISSGQYDYLRSQRFCGDICSRYIKRDGSYVEDELYNRVIGISLDAIKLIPEKIGLVVGEGKAAAALAALRGGFITHLFIDERSAKRVLELVRQ